MTLRLVALDCPSCGSALEGEGLDTIFFCQHCGDAATLSDEGLEMIGSAAVVPAPGRAAGIWRPAWSVEAVVEVADRVRYRGHRTPGWKNERTFVVPAFDMPLADLTRIVRGFASLSCELREVPREPIRGGTLAIEDVVTIIRHVVIGDEVRRSDMLASVRVEIDIVSKRLVALPFEEVPGGLRCSVTGVTVTHRNSRG